MIWYAWLATWLYLGIRDQLSADASVPFTLLWASCVAHAPFSVGLHCTIGVSAEQRSVWRTLDIGMIFTASFALAAAMGWYVLPGGAAYAAFLAAALGSYAAVVWQTMVARRMRDIPKPEVARYVACSVLTYALPMLAAAAREVAELGRPGPISRSVLYVGTALYVGGEVYARHLPERWAPGRFDTLCNSHQLMHLCAIAGHYLKWRLLCQLAARAGEPTLGWAAA